MNLNPIINEEDDLLVRPNYRLDGSHQNYRSISNERHNNLINSGSVEGIALNGNISQFSRGSLSHRMSPRSNRSDMNAAGIMN